ncbi:lmo0937 family membrane protein [uncultured Mucilaginibacter sp.]|uniref:lmo0937 family membrane protein n=1 Tax=uncultured Mucilaginibacter sp. TaxID=797541 RepID=UPI0025D35E16|nr:lmo0937 family membrane protein [uncultured Mucilaginibacter sp.]
MRSILYIVAVILIIGWAIGTFAYAAGGLIHILLVIAIIALLIGFFRSEPTV